MLEWNKFHVLYFAYDVVLFTGMRSRRTRDKRKAAQSGRRFKFFLKNYNQSFWPFNLNFNCEK